MDALILWLSNHAQAIGQFGGLWFGLGLVSLVFTIVALPIIVLRLPADYFVRHKRVPVARTSQHPVVAWLVTLVKNLVGIVLIVFGAVMLFIPGQGVLTMLIGILLLNFPGKYQLERRVVRRPSVLRTLNRIRKRGGHEPLLPPDADESVPTQK